jgi:hypothetical protein
MRRSRVCGCAVSTFALLASTATLPAVAGLGCNRGDPEEAVEELGDELEDAGEEVEDEVDDRS